MLRKKLAQVCLSTKLMSILRKPGEDYVHIYSKNVIKCSLCSDWCEEKNVLLIIFESNIYGFMNLPLAEIMSCRLFLVEFSAYTEQSSYHRSRHTDLIP